ncbi:MAG: DNA polymerase III subunit alpha [Deltaproteobacteria bacterium]|jgi:DNA polymerase-3 subunit alpha|nr:DNA polymerase III subunit alpha [Deltaproteobacteria bacterium]
MSFVHLHVHSCYSLLDGAIRINDLVKTAKDMGMPAVALTDHGQMFGLWNFYKAAVKAGIKPILGVEAYVTTNGRETRDKNEIRYHLTLLAENLTGFHNLCRMISLANVEGFYHKPRVDYDLLTKYSGGVLALSGCLQGEVPRAILSNRPDEAKKIAEGLAGIFPGRFYLEIQENGLPHQALANKGLANLAKETGIPLVATNDCHYLRREDHEAHDLLLCIQTGKLVTEPARMRMETNEFYFKSPGKMAEDFAWCPEALANTLAIADRCEVAFDNADPAKRVYFFPSLPGLSEGSEAETLRTQAAEGLEKRIQKLERSGHPLSEEAKARYRARLGEEVSIINEMNFPGYFLIVADFINWAKERKYPVGPGRGSAVGSLVSWSLGITDVDPIRFDLLFERFLNPERVSMPDIDVDFCAECRDDVIRYVTETYGGSDYVAQILTLGQMKAKAAIKAVGRAMDIPLPEVTAITKMVPDKPGTTLSEVLRKPEFRDLINSSPQLKKLIDMSLFVEDLPHHSSTHASGVVIGHKPLMEILPIFCDTKVAEENGRRTQVITQYDLKGVEENGLVKFDFLGLKTLTLIKHCLALLSKRGIDIDLLDLDYDDPKTYELLRSGDASGIFQIENEGILSTMVRFSPTRIEDLIALVAIYRPGPLQNRVDEIYINIKNGFAKPEYELEALRPILEETMGVIVYQEQVMRIAQVLANYTLGQADELRKAMGKKLPAEMEKHRAIFMKGATGNGVPQDKAKHIFDMMASFSEYGFNKSHSAGYAFIIFQTAYLKAHYPLEFMASLMSSEADDLEKIGRLIDECRAKGIEVLPPDVNTSSYGTSVKDGKIVFGLGAIKGVGQGAIEAIIEAREAKPFVDLFDFCDRVEGKKLNKRVVEALIKCGAMDRSGGAPRESLLAALPQALEQKVKAKKAKPLVSLLSGLAPPKPVARIPSARIWPQAEAMTPEERLAHEKELLGFYISGHPLNRYAQAFEAIKTHDMAQAKKLPNNAKVRVCGQLSNYSLRVSKKNANYATAKLSDVNDSIEVMFFDKLLKKKGDLLVEGAVLIVTGKVSGNDWNEKGRPKIVADFVDELDGSLSGPFPSLVVETSLENLRPVMDYLADKTEPHDPHARKLSRVFLKIFDGDGRAVYATNGYLELRVDFLTEATNALGRHNLVKCSDLITPYGQTPY